LANNLGQHKNLYTIALFNDKSLYIFQEEIPITLVFILRSPMSQEERGSLQKKGNGDWNFSCLKVKKKPARLSWNGVLI